MKSNLIALESMGGTERIMEALHIRGFFVEKQGDFIVLQEGNGREDLIAMKNLLDDLNIPTFWVGNQVQILVDNIPVAVMKKIIRTQGRDHYIGMSGYQQRWKYFVQRNYGPKTNTMDWDPNIAMLLKSLNLAGIPTLSGCEGHGRYAPHFRLMGPFTGAWFEIIQDRYLSSLPLYYQWKVEFDHQTGSILIAEKAEDQAWKPALILQDTVRMAFVLQEYHEEIRALKKKSFRRKGRMKAEAMALVEAENWSELRNWMRKLVFFR